MTTDVMSELRAIDALKTGHFLLASGRHSEQYIEKFNLLCQPAIISRLCETFAADARRLNAEFIAGPTTGGILLAFEVARQLSLPAAYAERQSDGSSQRTFRRGITFPTGAKIYIVDDILTTGGSVQETLTALGATEAEAVGIGVLVDRSGGSVTFGDLPLLSLVQLYIESWQPETCPLCRRGLLLVKPGTTQHAS